MTVLTAVVSGDVVSGGEWFDVGVMEINVIVVVT